MRSQCQCFGRKSAAAAHAVHEFALPVPTREADESRGQYFVERGAVLLVAAAADVQRFAAGIHGKGDLIVVKVQVDVNVRVLAVNARALAEFVAETVANGIF